MRESDGYGERCGCPDGDCWMCEMADQEEANGEAAKQEQEARSGEFPVDCPEDMDDIARDILLSTMRRAAQS